MLIAPNSSLLPQLTPPLRGEHVIRIHGKQLMELKLTFTEKQTAESSPESSIVRQIYRAMADMHCYGAILLLTAYDSRHLRLVFLAPGCFFAVHHRSQQWSSSGYQHLPTICVGPAFI